MAATPGHIHETLALFPQDTHNHMDEDGEEKSFNMDETLDSLNREDVYQPTTKTPSHFRHAHQVISEIKAIARPALVGPCKNDVRTRWGQRITLTASVRTTESKFGWVSL